MSETFIHINVFLLFGLSIANIVLLFLQPKSKITIASLSPESKHRLYSSTLRMVRILRLSLIVLPIPLIIISFTMHFFLGFNLKWLIALFSLLIFNIIEVLLSQSWLAKDLRDETFS